MKTAVVTGGTQNCIDYMASIGLNVKDTSPDIMTEMVILHDGVSDEIQKKLKNTIDVRFIKYKCPVSSLKLKLNPVIRYFSPMVFSKIECFRLLNEYDQVIWLDYDMFIKQDITELLQSDKDYSFLIDNNVPLKKMFREGKDYKKIGKYDFDTGSMVAAVFVLKRNDNTDYNELCDWYYKKLKKYSSYLYLPEQCLITMMLQEFNLEYDCIDSNIYNRFPSEDSDTAKILHSYGEKKFWNGIQHEGWKHYYDKWISIKESDC